VYGTSTSGDGGFPVQRAGAAVWGSQIVPVLPSKATGREFCPARDGPRYSIRDTAENRFLLPKPATHSPYPIPPAVIGDWRRQSPAPAPSASPIASSQVPNAPLGTRPVEVTCREARCPAGSTSAGAAPAIALRIAHLRNPVWAPSVCPAHHAWSVFQRRARRQRHQTDCVWCSYRPPGALQRCSSQQSLHLSGASVNTSPARHPCPHLSPRILYLYLSLRPH
jgi:hypothetical protein